MNPEQYYADPRDGRNLDGSLKTKRTVDKEDMKATQFSLSNRELYFEAAADYSRVFNVDHRVTGLVHFYRQELKDVNWGNGVLVSIPKRYQAVSSRLTYSYKDTYFVEGNLGYTGSEISIKNVVTVGSHLFPVVGYLHSISGIRIYCHLIIF